MHSCAILCSRRDCWNGLSVDVVAHEGATVAKTTIAARLGRHRMALTSLLRERQYARGSTLYLETRTRQSVRCVHFFNDETLQHRRTSGMNTAVLRRAIRLAIGGAVALSAPLAISVAVAQEKTPQEKTSAEEVIVTGSRIARGSDFDSPSPVVTVDREAIEKSGYNNLQQLMEKLPANGQGSFSTRGNNQYSIANVPASISLRGLAACATLLLA